MDKPPLPWILVLVPLIALLLGTAILYAHRRRRDAQLETSPVRKPSRQAFTKFLPRAMAMAKFRARGANDTSNGEAWAALHLRLIALSEQEHACLIALAEQAERMKRTSRKASVKSPRVFRG